MNRLHTIAVLVVASVVVTACSGDDDDTASTTPPTAAAVAPTTSAAPTTTATPATTAAPTTSEAPTTTKAPPTTLGYIAEDDSVLAIFLEREDTSRFAQLVAALDSNEVFQQERGITVLVPVDSAWEAYGEEAFQALLADRTALTLLMSEHLTIGGATADELVARGSFSNAMARDLVVAQDGDTVTIGDAVVLVADLTADNGVVHLIDRVITPPPAES